MTPSTPRIYVACLASYNNGQLYGDWIDATQEAEGIYADIYAMLKNSSIANAEEWAIHDYEGFGNLRLSEYESISSVQKKAAFIVEHGEDLGTAVLRYCDDDVKEASHMLEDRYCGVYASTADYAEKISESYTIPAPLVHYIDYQNMARDMEINGDITTIATAHDEVHIFHA